MLRLYIYVRGENLIVDVPRHVAQAMKLHEGKKVKVSLKFEACHVIAHALRWRLA